MLPELSPYQVLNLIFEHLADLFPGLPVTSEERVAAGDSH
jgi:hypothetical protein